MVSWSGYRLDEKKRVCDCVQVVFGIGLNKAEQIVSLLGFSKHISFDAVKNKKLAWLTRLFIHYVYGFPVKRNKQDRIELFKEIKAYRGLRHTYFLSVRGQRTHTNGRTQRSKKLKKKKVNWNKKKKNNDAK